MVTPILVAALVSFAVGALWYGPVFGKQWMKMMGYTRESMKEMKMTPAKAMALGFASQIVFSFVLSFFVVITSAFDLLSAALLAGLIWLGFYVTPTLGGYLWENRSLKLTLFNMAYQLVGLLATAAVISAFI